VPGSSATGRVLTATEEIDIRIQNASDDPVWKRESALLLAECKNWTSKCGKDEFTLFKDTLRNRTAASRADFSSRGTVSPKPSQRRCSAELREISSSFR
jgi:hypothetical protein